MTTPARAGGPSRATKAAQVKEEALVTSHPTTANDAVLRERRPARVKVNTWWCPWDDTGIAMLPNPAPCPVCGATVKVVGEEAVRDMQ